MKKQNKNLYFNYDIDTYKAGKAYKLDHLSERDIQRLLRRGCIYAPKDAKYYQEKKVDVKKEVKIEEVIEPNLEENLIVNDEKQDVEENVDIQNNEQTKVQAKSTKSDKLNK